MTFRTTRRRAICLASLLAALGATALPGLNVHAAPAFGALQPIPTHHFWDDLQLRAQPGDTWERLRDNLQWQDRYQHERVQHWIDYYRANPANVLAIVERARPWLFWINEQVELRGLPGEISLIPFVESAFDPHALSHRGAAGLWQFMPGTATALGLRSQGGYDGRLDVIASTQAALDYIELQAEQWYDGDIELSLAAYNAGAGTVNRARHSAAAQGEPNDYWHLSLPNETMHYLPKLYAIAAIIAEPERHGVALPDIDDAPAFAKVPVDTVINLQQLAAATGVDSSELRALNPGLTNGQASPATADVVLVPIEHEEVVLARLSGPSAEPVPGSAERHIVQQGDSLSAIASLHGVSVLELRQHNGLNGDVIQIGQALEIPRRSLAAR